MCAVCTSILIGFSVCVQYGFTHTGCAPWTSWCRTSPEWYIRLLWRDSGHVARCRGSHRAPPLLPLHLPPPHCSPHQEEEEELVSGWGGRTLKDWRFRQWWMYFILNLACVVSVVTLLFWRSSPGRGGKGFLETGKDGGRETMSAGSDPWSLSARHVSLWWFSDIYPHQKVISLTTAITRQREWTTTKRTSCFFSHLGNQVFQLQLVLFLTAGFHCKNISVIFAFREFKNELTSSDW